MKKVLFSIVVLCSAAISNAQVLVKDISPGMDGLLTKNKVFNKRIGPDFHIVYNGKMIFTASSLYSNFPTLSEPYISDGTPAGTKLLKNINPQFNSNPQFYTLYKGEVYFQADDGTHGAELWKTDGTESGTVMVKDIRSGNAGSFPANFIIFKNELHFLVTTVTGSELWKTDGTNSGTVKLRDNDVWINPAGKEMIVYKDTLFCMGTDRSLYRTGDGINFSLCTTPTGSTVRYIEELTMWDTNFIFIGQNANSTYNVGDEIYRYHPSDGVTLMCNMDKTVSSSYPTSLQPLGDKLYVTAMARVGISEELFIIDDDSIDKATLVKDINPGGTSSSPRDLTPLGGKIIFTAEVNSGGNTIREVWVSDGTEQGTIPLTNSPRATGGANYANFNEFTVLNGRAYFTYNPNQISQQNMLYETDGTVAGTKPVFNHSTDVSVKKEQECMVYNNELYYFADNGRIGNELYVLRKRDVAAQDSFLNSRMKVWIKADTNLMFSHTGNNTITTIMNDVDRYEALHGTSSNTPRTDPSIIQNARNGLAVIQFNADGKDGYLQTLTNKPLSSTQSATIITIAAKAATANNRNTLIGLRPVPGFAHNLLLAETNLFGSNKLSLGVHDGSSYCKNVGNSNWAANDQYSIITASVDKNIVYTKVNGITQDSVGNSCAITEEIRGLYIGGSDFDYEPFEGNIGEVFVFDTVLTRQQRNMLEMYLGLKFKAGVDTILNPNVGNSKGIYVLDNTGAAVYFVKNDDADNAGNLAVNWMTGNPGTGSGFTGSATSNDGTIVTPVSIGTNGYWKIVNKGLTDFEYDVMIDAGGKNVDSLDKRVILKRDNASAKWQPLNTKRFGNYLYAYGLTSFSEFAVSSNMPDTVMPPQSIISSGKQTEPAIMVYPNPFDDYILVQSASVAETKYGVVMQNIQGVTLLTSEITPGMQSPLRIDIKNLAPGIYVLQVVDNSTGQRHSTRIIKQ